MVHVVAQGPLVADLVTGSGFAGELSEALSGGGVVVVACANSLSAVGLSGADTVPGVVVADAAVEYLASKQALGWSYIKLDPVGESPAAEACSP